MTRGSLLVSAIAAVTAVSLAARAGAAPSATGWTGSAGCTLTVTGDGYHHSESQKWTLSGLTTMTGSFQYVTSRWTDTGSGSSVVVQGDQTRKAAWTVSAAASGQFRFFVRASDNRLVVGQANAQLRVHSGMKGTQQLTIGGVAQTPGPVDVEAFETQLPPMLTRAGNLHFSGVMPTTTIVASVGPFQPGGAVVTKRCNWRFTGTK